MRFKTRLKSLGDVKYKHKDAIQGANKHEDALTSRKDVSIKERN